LFDTQSNQPFTQEALSELSKQLPSVESLKAARDIAKQTQEQKLINALRRLIIAGRIKPGEKLPSWAQASEEISQLSKGVVGKAYSTLKKEGFIYTLKGKQQGTYVNNLDDLRKNHPSLFNDYKVYTQNDLSRVPNEFKPIHHWVNNELEAQTSIMDDIQRTVEKVNATPQETFAALRHPSQKDA
jgi:DNA-binding transcriptional regulator YhcF (GntR family)